MIKAVIDANVFVSAILRPASKPGKIIEMVKQGAMELVISHGILAEIRQVLLYPKIRKELQLTLPEIDGFLAAITAAAPKQAQCLVWWLKKK